MTWTKLSDDFGDECARVELSDSAFRTHVEGLLWTMRRESGGFISSRDIRRFAESPEVEAAVQELVNVGFWVASPSGYFLVMHLEHQPEPEVIEARREQAAERQRRRRAKALARMESQVQSQGESRRDNTRESRKTPGRDGTGRDGSGKPTTQREEHRDSAKREYLGGPVNYYSGER